MPASLSSPFGVPPPPPRPAPVPLRTVDHEVRDHRAVLRELAVASTGAPAIERWSGHDLHREPLRDDLVMSATTPPFAPPPSGPGSGRPVGPPSSPGGPAVAPGGRPGALSTESRLPKLAPATLAGQAAAFAVCVLAVGLLCAWLDQPVAFIVAVGVLAAGIAVGLTTGVGLRFTNAAGWVLGLLATVLMIMALGILHALTDLRLPWALSVLVGLFIVGLDWLYVQRLRGAVVLSGLFVVPLLAEGKGGETAAALVWFGGALVAFWLLERDGRAVVPTAEPVGGEGSTPSRRGSPTCSGSSVRRS